MTINNTFWFRHFLLCDHFAKEMCNLRGWHIDNFAKTVAEEELGRTLNNQMTQYFWAADKLFCELHESDKGCLFDNLAEDDGIYIGELSKLSEQELAQYYQEYCVGKIGFQLTNAQ